MRNLLKSFLLLVVAAPLAAQATQQSSTPAATPAVPVPVAGEMAPDFTIPWADGKGTKSEPLTLSKMRGQVVVLAFYPADFSGGCTIQLSKYRDEYQAIFGEGVTVVPISRDSLETHTRWVNDKSFPFALGSDTAGAVAKLYGSTGRGKGLARNVFVIGKDGKIAYSKVSFNVNAQVGYDELAAAVAAARK